LGTAGPVGPWAHKSRHYPRTIHWDEQHTMDGPAQNASRTPFAQPVDWLTQVPPAGKFSQLEEHTFTPLDADVQVYGGGVSADIGHPR